MAGVLLAFSMMLLLSARLVFVGGDFAWPFAILFAGIPFLVFRGLRLGYSLAKFVVGFLAVMMVAGALNPFMYEDFRRSGGNYTGFVTVMLFVGLLLIFAFYGLEEHRKIRAHAAQLHPD